MQILRNVNKRTKVSRYFEINQIRLFCQFYNKLKIAPKNYLSIFAVLVYILYTVKSSKITIKPYILINFLYIKTACIHIKRKKIGMGNYIVI